MIWFPLTKLVFRKFNFVNMPDAIYNSQNTYEYRIYIWDPAEKII